MAMHQDEIAYRPADRLDRLFRDVERIVEQRHMRLVRTGRRTDSGTLHVAEQRLPEHPDLGDAVAAGQDERAGRWAGQAKTECGLHSLDSSQL